MPDIISEINWLAVIAGGVIHMVIGGLWYGPIAGKAWMAEVGMTEEEIKAAGNPWVSILKSFFSTAILTFGMAYLFIATGMIEAGWQHGALVGAFLSLFIVGAATYPNYTFENKTLRHFLIHIGDTTVAMTLIGAMLTVWR